jgi:hypothetical protein
MPDTITLSTDEFALLFQYLDWEHSLVWNPETVGKITKIGGSSGMSGDRLPR